LVDSVESMMMHGLANPKDAAKVCEFVRSEPFKGDEIVYTFLNENK